MLGKPKEIQQKTGTIEGNRKCYLGKAITLMSPFGEVSIICNTADEAAEIARFIMPSGTIIYPDKAQGVVIFSDKFFSEDNQP